jgi:hypothetical protein
MEFIGSPIIQEEFDYRFFDFWNIDYSDIENNKSIPSIVDYSKTT